MKVHKYRGWHKKQHKMYSAEELGEDQLTLMPDGRGFVNVSGAELEFSQIDNGRTMIPLEYIGREDKHGKEIYIGDKVNCHVGGLRGEAAVEVKSQIVNYDDRGNLRMGDLSAWFCSEEEIVGNIYENPELLEGT